MNNLIKNLIKAIFNPHKLFFFIKRNLYELFIAFWDSKKIKNTENVLFIDCGANVGQGFNFFSKFFKGKNITFYLFEPNPNCHKFLKKITKNKNNVYLESSAVGISTGSMSFYGLGSSEWGKLSLAGSLLKSHNNIAYKASEENKISVKSIDFSNFLKQQKKKFDKIIVKMDIEGYEIELLNNLIMRKTFHLIDVLYVEFHSRWLKEPERTKRKKQEEEIIQLFKKSDVKLRVWH